MEDSSGQQDLNLRPRSPEPRALPSWAMPRFCYYITSGSKMEEEISFFLIFIVYFSVLQSFYFSKGSN